MRDGQFLIHLAVHGGGGEAEFLAVQHHLDITLRAALNLFFRNQVRTFERRGEPRAVHGDENILVVRDDALVIDVFAVHQAAEIGHAAEAENDIFQRGAHGDARPFGGGQQVAEFRKTVPRNDAGEVDRAHVARVLDLTGGGAARERVGVARHDLQPVGMDAQKRAAEHGAVIALGDRVNHAPEQVAQQSAVEFKDAVAAGKVGQRGKILARQGGDGEGRAPRGDGGVLLFIDRDGDFAVRENLDDRHQPACLDDNAARLEDFHRVGIDARTFIHIKGGEAHVGVALFFGGDGFHVDALDGGNGVFGGNRAEGRRDGVEQFLLIKDDFHGNLLSGERCETFF